MEYWDFIGAYLDFSTEDGLQKLEHYMKERYDTIHRASELDRELSLVSDRLNQLKLTSPTSPVSGMFGGKSLGNIFGGGGDTLVLYMDKSQIPDDSHDTNRGDGEGTDEKLTQNKTNEQSQGDCQNVIENPNETLPPGQVSSNGMTSYLQTGMRTEFWEDDIRLIDDSDSDSSVDSFHTALDMEDSDCESLFTPPQSLSPCPHHPDPDDFFIYG
jgi:hypothetical protein